MVRQATSTPLSQTASRISDNPFLQSDKKAKATLERRSSAASLMPVAGERPRAAEMPLVRAREMSRVRAKEHADAVEELGGEDEGGEPVG